MANRIELYVLGMYKNGRDFVGTLTVTGKTSSGFTLDHGDTLEINRVFDTLVANASNSHTFLNILSTGRVNGPITDPDVLRCLCMPDGLNGIIDIL